MTTRRLKHGRACICAECQPRRGLACGCTRYVELCPEAERLWDAVNDTHNEATRRHREGEPTSAKLWQPVLGRTRGPRSALHRHRRAHRTGGSSAPGGAYGLSHLKAPCLSKAGALISGDTGAPAKHTPPRRDA